MGEPGAGTQGARGPGTGAQPGARNGDIARAAQLGLAILWYDRGLISQGKGAELAGLTRAEFIDELGRATVGAIQTSVEELREEMQQVRHAGR